MIEAGVYIIQIIDIFAPAKLKIYTLVWRSWQYLWRLRELESGMIPVASMAANSFHVVTNMVGSKQWAHTKSSEPSVRIW